MSSRSVAEGYFDAVSRGDIDAAIEMFTPDAEFVGPMGALPIPDGVRGYLQTFDQSFPGARFEVSNAIEQGDQVVLEGTWSGKHTATLQLPDGTELPPTDREARGPFAIVFEVKGGKITAHRGYWDLAGFMAQLTS